MLSVAVFRFFQYKFQCTLAEGMSVWKCVNQSSSKFTFLKEISEKLVIFGPLIWHNLIVIFCVFSLLQTYPSQNRIAALVIFCLQKFN